MQDREMEVGQEVGPPKSIIEQSAPSILWEFLPRGSVCMLSKDDPRDDFVPKFFVTAPNCGHTK